MRLDAAAARVVTSRGGRTFLFRVGSARLPPHAGSPSKHDPSHEEENNLWAGYCLGNPFGRLVQFHAARINPRKHGSATASSWRYANVQDLDVAFVFGIVLAHVLGSGSSSARGKASATRPPELIVDHIDQHPSLVT